MAIFVCECPSIDLSHGTNARLFSCKSSPDIQVHGDLQDSVSVTDDGVYGRSVSRAEGLTVILLITLMSCVCVSMCTPSCLSCRFL